MKYALTATLVATMALGGCGFGGSRYNPMNWFGGSEETAVVETTDKNTPFDGRQLVREVSALVIEPNNHGAIVRATGIAPSQGFWDGELVLVPQDDGRQLYEFRVFPPTTPKAVSTARSREITVATYISAHKLRNIKEITVQGETNARSTRR